VKSFPLLRLLKNNDTRHLIEEMNALGVEAPGIEIMTAKGAFQVIKTEPISAPAANILKQQMLSIGGECAVSRHAADCSIVSAPVILMGTFKHFQRLAESLRHQYFGLPELGEEIARWLRGEFEPHGFRVGDRFYPVGNRTYVMGILNLTPDSFYRGSRINSTEQALETAVQMEAEGADFIDLGGESSRPGADPLPLEEELKRVVPVVERLTKTVKIPVSVDTYKSEVAAQALQSGAKIINDISGLHFDSRLPEIIAHHQATAILMHIKGTPRNMQDDPRYVNLIDEILDYLQKSARQATDAGLEKERIILDPGIGFGKIVADNYTILRYLTEFKSLGYPILIGPSRKSFIGKVLDLPPEERLEGTLAAIAVGVQNGADVVRVHDVKATVRAVRIAENIRGGMQ